MSGTAWLAARLAGYLGGWQPLLDTDCVCTCLCVASLCAHARSLYMTGGACPPSHFLLAQKRATKATTCSPAQIEHPEQKGVLTLTPSLQWSLLSQPCSQPFSLYSPGKWRTKYTIVHAVAIQRRQVSSISEFPFLKFWNPTGHQLTCFLFLALLLLSSWLWSFNSTAVCAFSSFGW